MNLEKYIKAQFLLCGATLKDIARDTIRKNRNRWKYIENSELTEKSMRDITIDDLSRLFKSMTQGRKITRSNFNNFKTFLNLLWDYAVEDYRACDHTKSGLTEGAREIPFFSDGLLTLQKIKLLNCDEEFLFLGKSGKFILTQEINQNLKDACKDLEIAYRSSHKIRKWAATEAVRQGMDEVSLMYSFGWKNRQTAEHYIRAGRTQQSQHAILSKVFDRTAETNLTDCN